MKINIGARNSKLSKIQTEFTLLEFAKIFPFIEFDVQYLSSPGDRDKNLDLRESPEDFFTKDLDEAIENGRIDCAIHSAKDLPSKLSDKIDYFWLPWHEDPRDVIILRRGFELENLHNFPLKIGISSKRREEYCKRYFPDSILLPLRGNIDERLEKLDNGQYDMIIAAGLKRLGLENRISKYIPLEEMQVPEGQGILAITYKKNNPLFNLIRKFFIYPVCIAGAGPGNPNLITEEAIEKLKECDVCIYDALCPDSILSKMKKGAKAVFAGKRAGTHSFNQDEINFMIANFAKQGKKVLRLKGGDPGIFGRLAEETEYLNSFDIPFKVIPGISSLQSATTSTGMLLTRRGLSRGFMVFTPRTAISGNISHLSKSEIENLPLVIFMSIKELETLAEELLNSGRRYDEAIAIVFSAGTKDEKIIHTRLSELKKLKDNLSQINAPGIILCGKNFEEKYLFPKSNILSNKTILITSSSETAKKASNEAERYGADIILMPMIKFSPISESKTSLNSKIENYKWLLITSPTSAKILFETLRENKCDLRKLPRIISSGPETSFAISEYGIFPDLQADSDFGTKGVFEKIIQKLSPEESILRIISDQSSRELTEKLKSNSFKIDELALYKTLPVQYTELAPFDAIFFASPSAVKAFSMNFGNILEGKDIISIGEVTSDAVKKTFSNYSSIVMPYEATASSAIKTYAIKILEKKIENLKECNYVS
ncbi:MAG TPA: uroporphyrinogen-III C-methyltransferase [Victivallales bacterium]|nr:uroporphyrinogen-III C-methyltransferase [Victivallales bacterium]